MSSVGLGDIGRGLRIYKTMSKMEKEDDLKEDLIDAGDKGEEKSAEDKAKMEQL